MARWDDLHRGIAARDAEGIEQVWLELLETDVDETGRFIDAAKRLSEQPGGKRQAGMLLWMLAETLKEKDRPRDLIRVCVALSTMAPDDGTVRKELVEAARKAFADRADLDSLLEKSGVEGGLPSEFAAEAGRLERYLQMEPGAYVFHKSGWGVGRIVKYLAERGRCVIDFHDKPGHEMDIEAAAGRLERLDETDIRAMAMSDPKRLRKWASEEPLEMVRQVLSRFSNSVKLRHIKDALVPDAVATSRWSTWWKEAKKLAHIDPRFHVGSGRDPVIEYHDTGAVDFKAQVERSFRGCPTVTARQKSAREFLQTVQNDEEAKQTLGELVSAERQKATKIATKLGWDLILAQLDGREEREALEGQVIALEDPKALMTSIPDDELRAASARVIMEARENGPELVLEAMMDQDDPVLAEVGYDRFAAAGRPEMVPQMLDEIDAKPAIRPNLWAWYVRGLLRNRWDGRSYEAYPLLTRLLKVIDAVEYRSRRGGTLKDKAGVSTLNDVLVSKQAALVKEAAEHGDASDARHLVRVVEKNRGVRGRVQQRVTTIVLRARPEALREDEEVEVDDTGVTVGERMDRIYMTPEGKAKLKAERDEIVNVEMPENAKEIARAREFGDLSENAEYHAAREKQGLLQARADAMSSDLARAVELTPEIVHTEAVSVGTRVRVKDAEGHEITYTLLGPPDVDVKNGVINYLTPLAQALMGKTPGEHVQVQFEDGERDVEVLSIESHFAPAQ